MMGTGAKHLVERTGVFTPTSSRRRTGPASSASSRARSRKCRHAPATPSPRPLPGEPGAAGSKPAQPVVFCGLFPVDAADFEDLRAGRQARLNDASFLRDGDVGRARLRLCRGFGLLHLGSSRSGWSASSISTSYTAPSVYRSRSTTATSGCTTPPTCLMSSRSPRSRAVDPRDDPDPRRLSQRS